MKNYLFYSALVVWTLNTNAQTVTDVDGNIYITVVIGTQTWINENLKTTKYRNGDIIGTTTPATLNITNEIMPYQWPNCGDEDSVATYGRLYTWYAAIDNRGICPTGFHVPTDAEWKILQDYLYKNDYGCLVDNFVGIAKSMATKSGWVLLEEPCAVGNDQESNNTSGFTAVPSGHRLEYGLFNPNGYSADWWGLGSDENPVSIGINFGSAYVGYSFAHEEYGISVRCLKDNNTSNSITLNSSEIIIFPNPAYEKLYISPIHNLNGSINIFDIQGKLVIDKTIVLKSVDISFLKPGLYFLKFIKSDNIIINKFIKE